MPYSYCYDSEMYLQVPEKIFRLDLSTGNMRYRPTSINFDAYWTHG